MTVPALAVVGGGLRRADEPLLRADDLGVLRGDGLFETLWVHRGRPVLVKEHFARMAEGARAMALTLPDELSWAEAIAAALGAGKADEAVLRLVLTRGPEGGEPTAYVLVSPIPPLLAEQRSRGVRAVTLPSGLDVSGLLLDRHLLSGVKTTSYARNMSALREAVRRGAEEAIWLDANEDLLEAPTANVVWLQEGVAYTPPADAGVLRGTTLTALRSSGLLAEEVVDESDDVNALIRADEVLLCSSVRGVVAVTHVDGHAIGDGTPGPGARRWQDAYEAIAAR